MSAPVVDRVLRSVSADSVVLANVSRRRFLKGMSLGGLVLAVGFQSAAGAQEPKKYGADGMPNGWVDNPLAFVSIAEDGTVTIVCHRSEMGQGVRTGMPHLRDRKSTRLNSSHSQISYAVFCLKKKKKNR